MKFRGSEQAVRFAYNISGREIAARPTYGPRSGARHGMGPHELHAQGAMILAAVARLQDPKKWAIEAVLAPGEWRVPSIVLLANWLWPSVKESVDSKSQATIALLSAITKRPSVRKMAGDFGVSYRKAREWRRVMQRQHGLLYLQAVAALDEALFGEGGLELAE